jgi:hypothetical protein
MSTDSVVQSSAETQLPPSRAPKELALGVLRSLPEGCPWDELL